MTRRRILSGATLLAGGLGLLRTRIADAQSTGDPVPSPPKGPYTPVITPNGSTLPWVMKDGAKEFRLVAEAVKREFAAGMVVDCWGYNGQTPGPTIEVVEGG